MSFLAQLREQSSPQMGLGLCYVLRLKAPDSVTCLCQLQLHLAEFEQQQLCRKIERYQPQAAHLSSPPPFLSTADIDILRNWPDLNSANIKTEHLSALLGAIVQTERCFIDEGSGRWRPLCRFEPQAQNVALQWQITPWGEHRLYWQSGSGRLYFWLATQLFEFDSSAQCLTALSCDFNDDIFSLLQQWQCIPVNRIEAFAAEHQRWSRAGLPALLEPECIEAIPLITPVLHFSTHLFDSVTLAFRYCCDSFCANFDACHEDELGVWDGAVLHRVRRDHQVEQNARALLESFLDGFQQTSDSSWHSDDIELWHRLLGGDQVSLREAGFRFLFEPGFSHPLLTAQAWQARVSEQDDGQWQLALQLSFSSGPTAWTLDLLPLLGRLDELAVETSQHYISLSLGDGYQLLLPRQQLSLLRDELPDIPNTSRRAPLTFPASQLSRLQSFAAALPEHSQWHDDDGLLQRAGRLRQELSTQPLSLDGLRASLRSYQQHGVCWLQHIKRQGSNGLLADDMGLGKTLQTIAHLWLEKQSGALDRPALIVAPSSLLHNWADELQRFTPQLRVQCLQGSQRHALWSGLGDMDILITSYALLKRDLDQWRLQSLSWLVLDEAQQIKNPATRISRAVREITSDYRLCLSGTPMENHLGELWSLFDFLMPGSLGSERSFKRHFRKPIEQQGNRARYIHLLSRITPFMLRRGKNEVAGELPPKTEIALKVPMDEAQESLYQSLKQRGQSELNNLLEQNDDPAQQRIHALTLLLKLRQACCDPALLGETAASAKRQHCLEMIEELTAEGRSVLVFSQFTRMLDLLADDLQHKSIPYLTLTGTTRNRAEQVTAFQAGDAPVFLISLKAGGTGLNLTRADTVIHYDPWWNDAAQQQASDRAHRIGQDKPVFVYKLIIENSIEEKIAELQAHKAQLSEHINSQAMLQSDRFTIQLDDILALLNDE